MISATARPTDRSPSNHSVTERVESKRSNLAERAESKRTARAASAERKRAQRTERAESKRAERTQRAESKRTERTQRAESKRTESAERTERERTERKRTESAARAQSPRPHTPSATSADIRAQLKLALSTIDAVLVAIERSALEFRSLGENARSLFDSGKSAGQRKLVSPLRAFQNELTQWPARISRLTGTGLVLGSVAASYRLHTTKAAFMSRAGAERSRQELHEECARKLYKLSIRHGGAFLKLGQMLASRPDLLPEPYIRELGKLHDAAPAVAYRDIARVLESELGRPVAELFESFEEEPVAAASIGQVHRATLRDGRQVAVKVQRPNIAALVELDMSLLDVFIRALAEGLPPLDFDTIIRETRAMVDHELDYTREAELTAQMHEFFAAHTAISVPRVVAELSTRRVLVTEFMPGKKVTSELDRLAAARDAGDTNAAAQLTTLLSHVFEAYARQVLDAGMFQADPHPGNLLADERGQLTVLDFGCAKVLDEGQRTRLLALLRATVVRDFAAMGEAMEAMGFRTKSGSREGLVAYARVSVEQMGLVKSADGGFCNQMEMVSRIAEFGRFVENDPIVNLPEEFVMLGRVFGTLSGLFVHYRPDVSATARVLPIVFSALVQSAR